MRILCGVWLLSIACAMSSATADVIATRAELNSLLGGSALTEDFEDYSVMFAETIPSPFDATSTPNGQGPGLVVPGLRLSRSTAAFSMLGASFLGGSSQRLTWNLQAGFPMVVDFLTPTDAFGLDLLSLFTTGSTSVTIFAPDLTTVIATLPVSVNSPSVPTFVGFHHPGGIGRVSIDTVSSVGPAIDNITFGRAAVVPEPSTWAIWTTVAVTAWLGCWRTRQKRAVSA